MTIGTDEQYNADVYTLQGVKVGSMAEWNALPRGIYVVDGKVRTKQ